jgi:Tol biopolymer transport system component
VDPATGEEQALTGDASPLEAGAENETIRYCCPRWSTDSRLLAFQRELGMPVAGGFRLETSLWIYEADSGIVRPALEEMPVSGYAWRPGAHLIAFALPVAPEYFSASGPEAQYAQGIMAVDADTGEVSELVAPERGFSLLNPRWSDDGRFLGFEEILAMEGRGQFAYYDFEAQEYFAWEKAIGNYDWSPDGERIAYDYLTYIPTGTERIWINDRQGQNERALTAEAGPGSAYTFNPVFSPQGDQLAYLAGSGGLENPRHTLFVQPVEGGEPRQLGTFERVNSLGWSPDGERLIFSAGSLEGSLVLEVNVSDGSVRTLAPGSEPAW